MGNDLYRSHEANILETSFSIPQIEQAVKEHFEIKCLFDPRNTEAPRATQSLRLRPQGPTLHYPTALAPTILRLRCPSIFLGVDGFDP